VICWAQFPQHEAEHDTQKLSNILRLIYFLNGMGIL